MDMDAKIPVLIDGGPRDGQVLSMTRGISRLFVTTNQGEPFAYRPTGRFVQDMEIWEPENIH